MRKRAFTLIELLVVIAIIAILAAILFPVFAKARERAAASACISNSNQIGKSLMMYTDDHDGAYPLNRFYRNGTPSYPYTWKRAMDPYVKTKDVWSCPSNAAKRAAGSRALSFESPIGDESNIRHPAFANDTSRASWLPSGHSYNGGAFHEELGVRNLSRIKNPAGVAVILESRTANPDLGPWVFTWMTDPTGTRPPAAEGSGGRMGVFHHHNKRMTVTFADGHSAGVSLPQMYQQNMWGVEPGSYRYDGRWADVQRGAVKANWPPRAQEEYW